MLVTDGVNDAVAVVNEGDKPLALYVFSERKAEVAEVLDRTSSGGACVNGTLLHVSNPNLPFGGVGDSGMGAYHGKFGFDTFSHHRAVHVRSTKLDPPMMYPPFTARRKRCCARASGCPTPPPTL